MSEAVHNKIIERLERLDRALTLVAEDVVSYTGQLAIGEPDATRSAEVIYETAERVSDALGTIFSATGTVMRGEAQESQTQETPEKKLELDETESAVMHYFLQNPNSRLEEAKRVIPEAKDWKVYHFMRVRERIVAKLESDGVAAEWLSFGQTRGKRYTLVVSSSAPAEADSKPEQHTVNGRTNEHSPDSYQAEIFADEVEQVIRRCGDVNIDDLVHEIHGKPWVDPKDRAVIADAVALLARKKRISRTQHGFELVNRDKRMEQTLQFLHKAKQQ